MLPGLGCQLAWHCDPQHCCLARTETAKSRRLLIGVLRLGAGPSCDPRIAREPFNGPTIHRVPASRSHRDTALPAYLFC